MHMLRAGRGAAGAVVQCLVALTPGGGAVSVTAAWPAASTRSGDARPSARPAVRGVGAGRCCLIHPTTRRAAGRARALSLAAAAAPAAGLGPFSIETTPKLSARVAAHSGILPPATLVYVAAIPGTSLQVPLACASLVTLLCMRAILCVLP
jgi:hypothetical protein